MYFFGSIGFLLSFIGLLINLYLSILWFQGIYIGSRPLFFLGIFIFKPRFWAEEAIYFETFYSLDSWWQSFDEFFCWWEHGRGNLQYLLLGRFGWYRLPLVSILGKYTVMRKQG